MKAGDYLKVKTRPSSDGTIDFGEVVYKIIDVNTYNPHTKGNDGVFVEMIGGSGKNSKSGVKLFDTISTIELNIRQGITTIITEERALAMVKAWEDLKKTKTHPGGMVEMD